MSENPYLKSGRLPNVIAAITTLGTYRYYKLSFEKCAERICNKPEEAHRWGQIFLEHPEFFRINPNNNMASLVWRRQNPKLYDTRNHKEISRSDFDNLNDHEKRRISRRPLAPAEITALIDVAINLHERALDQSKARKWWIPIFTAVLSFIGAIAGVWITSLG